jgi:hypothetical protein
MDRLQVGQVVRILGRVSSRYQGKIGTVIDVVREPQSRPDWDMCVVTFGALKSQIFPAFDLQLIDGENGLQAA